VYTTGIFNGTGGSGVDFDPDGGASAFLSSYGTIEVFVWKLDSSGDYVWAKKLLRSSGNGGSAWDIVVDSGDDNVYIVGSSGTADFDPGAGTTEASGNYVWKLETDGDFGWVKILGATEIRSVALDDDDNVYTTGYFAGTADFDPGAGTANLTSAGSDDVFISKLDSSGNYVWARAMGGTSGDIGFGAAVDDDGNVFATGYMNSTIDVDPDACSQTLSSAGGRDIFVWQLDSSGILN
jgi:hypothetical protein